MSKMANEKRLIDAIEYCRELYRERDYPGRTQEFMDAIEVAIADLGDMPTVDAVEVPCHCCDCYYLLNSKNSFGLYFLCGHQNGLKNLTNTEKNFCPYGKSRYDNERKAD